VPKMRFSDGIEFDTDGYLRVEHRKDGYYVVGEGMLVPVDSYDDGIRMVESWNHETDKRTQK
jgi:hypothetical protein